MPEIREAIYSTELAGNLNELLELSRLSREEQIEIVCMIVLGEAKNVKGAKTQLRRIGRIEKINEIVQNNVSLDTVKRRYPVIYADPPWRYEYSETDNRKVENQYPTMTLEEICALPVDSIATEHAVLFLWTPLPKLAEAMQVISSWGFVHRTGFVWDKVKMGPGKYLRQQNELLLIAARGDLPRPEPEYIKNLRSQITIPRSSVHSEKPEEFYRIIEGMYPHYEKIELFSRKKRNGWNCWGNQI